MINIYLLLRGIHFLAKTLWAQSNCHHKEKHSPNSTHWERFDNLRLETHKVGTFEPKALDNWTCHHQKRFLQDVAKACAVSIRVVQTSDFQNPKVAPWPTPWKGGQAQTGPTHCWKLKLMLLFQIMLIQLVAFSC